MCAKPLKQIPVLRTLCHASKFQHSFVGELRYFSLEKLPRRCLLRAYEATNDRYMGHLVLGDVIIVGVTVSSYRDGASKNSGVVALMLKEANKMIQVHSASQKPT